MEFTEKFKLKYRVRVDCKTQEGVGELQICTRIFVYYYPPASSLEYTES